jgi:hypothetical protein
LGFEAAERGRGEDAGLAFGEGLLLQGWHLSTTGGGELEAIAAPEAGGGKEGGSLSQLTLVSVEHGTAHDARF